MDKFISGNNTIRENWTLALKDDGVVSKSEISAIVVAAKAWGGVSSQEFVEAQRLLDETETYLKVDPKLHAAAQEIIDGLNSEATTWSRWVSGPVGNLVGHLAKRVIDDQITPFSACVRLIAGE